MPALDWLTQFWSRLLGYPLWQVAVELLIIAALVTIVWRFVKGTRVAGALVALIVIMTAGAVVVEIASQRDLFPRLSSLYSRLLAFSAIALVVIFQPELRRALIRIGELPVARPLFRGVGGASEAATTIDAVVDACRFLSKNKFGAIIAIERQVGLREMLVGSTMLNAEVSAELIESIFWPNNPLHDMGVVVRGQRIVAAGVQFPLVDAEEMRDQTLGTRHRAAVGLTRVTDAVVVVVSEETGAISIAERGRLDRWKSPESLRAELTQRLRMGSAEDGGNGMDGGADAADMDASGPTREASPASSGARAKAGGPA